MSKKDDKYEAIYMLKVAIEAILLPLEQYLSFVYIESLVNCSDRKRNRWKTPKGIFDAIIKLLERLDETFIRHLVIT